MRTGMVMALPIWSTSKHDSSLMADAKLGISQAMIADTIRGTAIEKDTGNAMTPRNWLLFHAEANPLPQGCGGVHHTRQMPDKDRQENGRRVFQHDRAGVAGRDACCADNAARYHEGIIKQVGVQIGAPRHRFTDGRTDQRNRRNR